MNDVMITVGGALVGLLAALPVLLPWWKKNGGGKGFKGGAAPAGGRNWRSLAPFGIGLVIGVLSATCVGGLLGGAAHSVGSGSNAVGDWLLTLLTGARSQGVTRHGLARLQAGGAVVLLLLIAGIAMLWKQSSKTQRTHITCGILSGCTLGPTAGLAGLTAVAIVPVIDWLGGMLVGAL